jgi:plastocyanin
VSFTPRDLAAGGGALTITLQNDGRLTHNLTIDELALKIVASPGKAKTVTIPVVAPGAYTFYCSVSGHREAGMFGTLTVK